MQDCLSVLILIFKNLVLIILVVLILIVVLIILVLVVVLLVLVILIVIHKKSPRFLHFIVFAKRGKIILQTK